MSPLNALAWVAVGFVTLAALSFVGLGIRYILFSPPCPDPEAHNKTEDEGRTVDL